MKQIIHLGKMIICQKEIGKLVKKTKDTLLIRGYFDGTIKIKEIEIKYLHPEYLHYTIILRYPADEYPTSIDEDWRQGY